MAKVYDQELEKDLLRATLILIKMNQWVLPFLRLGTITFIAGIFSLDAAILLQRASACFQKQFYCGLGQLPFRQLNTVTCLQYQCEQDRLTSTHARSLKRGRGRAIFRFAIARSWNNQGFLTSTPRTFHLFTRVFVQLPMQQESGA